MKNLFQLRREYGITRRQLAEKTGLSISAIGHYERGDRLPRLNTARTIVTAIISLTNGKAKPTIEGLFPSIK